MASEKTKALAKLVPTQSFLGRYRHHEETVAGKTVMAARRDEWSPGEQFKDQSGRSTYEVQVNGSLKRI